MHALETLDLSNNHLVGPLSPRIGQLGYLTTLRLHFNALTGAIPLELSECIDLKTLRLEHNRFQGPLLNLFQHGLDRLSLLSLHHNNITSLPKTLPSHVQVW
jgi:Leucine-rich repeat (LRR) protein